MNTAKIAGQNPAVLELEPGDYFWCRCGLSNKQPFCDGTHQGTAFLPLKLTLDRKKQVALCQCKRTANEPHCDGTHTTLKG